MIKLRKLEVFEMENRGGERGGWRAGKKGGETGWEGVEALVDGKRVAARMGEIAVMEEVGEEADAEEKSSREGETQEKWPLEKMFEKAESEIGEERGHDERGGEQGRKMSELDEESLRQIGEMTKEEASDEYLDILDELSRGFTSAEAKASGPARYDRNGEVVPKGTGYDGQKNRIVGQLEGAEGKHADREWSIAMADEIIRAESDWRKVGEDVDPEKERVARDQAKLRLEIARKGAADKLERFETGTFAWFRKLVFRKKHIELQNQVRFLQKQEPERTPAERKVDDANARMKKALEAAYSEDYRYGHHQLGHGRNAEKLNENFNKKFFNEENAEKIERAVALRRHLEGLEPRISTAWKDKYWMESARNGEGAGR